MRWLVVFSLFSLAAVMHADIETCLQTTVSREDCGDLSSDEESCLADGCCWDPKDNQPWCYEKIVVPEGCDQENQRVDCGELGTTEDECEDMNCCWVPSDVPGMPWCFHKKGLLPPECQVQDREDCGELGSTQETCEADGCCWEPINDGPWCFKPEKTTKKQKTTRKQKTTKKRRRFQ